MKKIFTLLVVFVLMYSCKTDKENDNKEVTVDSIDTTTVRKHLYTLASDEMEGRRTGTPGIEKAAQYIEGEFKRIGLQTYEGLTDFRQTFTFEDRRTKKEVTAFNVIGILEGKSRKDEYVVVSGHYDHLGIRKREGQLDSIYNGADDDASVTTAVLALAEYFKKKGNNERTIIFVAFTGEEMGLLGSRHFGKDVDASKFVAGINIEMIGKDSEFGSKTAWLTGFDRSDFGKIIQKNLEGTGYVLHPDPYDKQNLFFRSDNASLARLGIPSHTFSTVPLPTDKHYHKASDEATTLKVEVVTETIRAIALGTESIINGKDTPTRVQLTEKEMGGRR
jgi:Zn-dependent M28 family amino/carboxypeptidase